MDRKTRAEREMIGRINKKPRRVEKQRGKVYSRQLILLYMKTYDLQARAKKYLGKMEPSIAGQRGHDKLFAAAVALVQGFGMEPDLAAELLITDFNPRCVPEWSHAEILHKAQSALKDYDGRKERGWLISGASSSEASIYSTRTTKTVESKKEQFSKTSEKSKPETWFYRQDVANGYFWRMTKEVVYPDGRTFETYYIWTGFRYENPKPYKPKNDVGRCVIEDWLHIYDDGDGMPYQLVHRLKFSNGQKITPVYSWSPKEKRYVAGAGNLPRIPYNAVQLKEAQFVRIVEGEKAADALSRYLYGKGLLTVDHVVTTFGGAKCFNADMACWFVDKDILIYPDNDAAGMDAANRISNGLSGVARSIKIICWSDGFTYKGDIVDWLNSMEGKNNDN